ncbi:MAG: 4-hydroxythreonine-4-phosphate dehydrogenase PdxA [Clostridia bacterium]
MKKSYLHQKPVIGITLGDIAGIGPELVAKAASKGILEEYGQPIIIGDERALRRGMEIAKVTFGYKVTKTIEEAVKLSGLVLLDTQNIDAYSVNIGEENTLCGKDAGMNIKYAVEYCKQGLIEGICFAPNNKTALKAAGFVLHGAIDLLAGFFGCEGYRGELSVLDNAWTARVTSHIPVKEISDKLTVKGILDAVNLVNTTQKLAGIKDPRIAVAALNPHAGEGGTCGRDEIDVIGPAVEQAKINGVNACGPFSADTLFKKLFDGQYDAVVTMFHDQGQIAMKLKGFENGTTIMAGLPYPVTTCSHGSAFDIAGKGIASSGAWESAYKIVAKMASESRKNK